MKKFYINKLDNNTWQLYGGVTGIMFKEKFECRDMFTLEFRFMNNDKRLIKVKTNTKTLSNLKKAINYIYKVGLEYNIELVYDK